MHVVVQISTAFLGDEEEEESVVNLPISLGAADLYQALETIYAKKPSFPL
jgi:hypothetical protein